MPRLLLCLPPFAFAAILAATGAPGDRFWAADVSPQRRAELTPLRRELEAALAELGPSPAERIAELRASPAQRRRMRELVETWNRRPQNGDGGLIRARQRDDLLEHFGLQALPVLLRALDGRAFWERRTAATACQLLVERYGDQARWHLLRAEAPADVIELIGVGPYAERVGVLHDVEACLEVVLERDPLGEAWDRAAARDFWENEQIRVMERRLRKAWRDAYAARLAAFREAEAQREARRRELEQALDAVSHGERPEELAASQ